MTAILLTGLLIVVGVNPIVRDDCKMAQCVNRKSACYNAERYLPTRWPITHGCPEWEVQP